MLQKLYLSLSAFVKKPCFHQILKGTLRFYSSKPPILPDLITAKQLASLVKVEKIQLVDTRNPEDYELGHIPGAVNIGRIFSYLTDDSSPKKMAEMRQEFAYLFGQAGISRSDNVVAYDQTMMTRKGAACRGYFIFKYLGTQNVSVLEGGLMSWEMIGQPITKQKTIITPVKYEVHETEGWMLTKDDVLKAVKESNAIIVDCRDEDEWLAQTSSPYGADYCPRKGRIPNAKWILWTDLLEKDAQDIPRFKKPGEIRKICYERAGIKEDSEVQIYCFKGARAANTLLAMKTAGIKNVGNYFASWNEWSRNENMPIEIP